MAVAKRKTPLTQWVEEALLHSGMSQAQLARALETRLRTGFDRSKVYKIIDGQRRLSAVELLALEEVTKFPAPASIRPAETSQYSDGTVNQPPEVSSAIRSRTLQIIPGEQLMGENDLPVYSIVQGGRGAVVLSSEPFTHTRRPKRLIGIANGYGVLVKGNSMAREYSENDIAYVDPHLHPKMGDPCVFQGEREDGTWEAMIKYLERSPDASETVYYVSQTEPPKKFTIKKADWQKCHVAVGKESGR